MKLKLIAAYAMLILLGLVLGGGLVAFTIYAAMEFWKGGIVWFIILGLIGLMLGGAWGANVIHDHRRYSTWVVDSEWKRRKY